MTDDTPTQEKPAEDAAAVDVTPAEPASEASAAPAPEPVGEALAEGAPAAIPLLDESFEAIALMRDMIFERLVTNDGDVVGLLAYSLSKQNKRDFVVAFRKQKGREPNAAEMEAFDIGETIERRVGTYRKLAEVAMAGDAFWSSSTVTPVSEMSGVLPTATVEQAVAPPPETSMASFSPPPKKEGWFIKKR